MSTASYGTAAVNEAIVDEVGMECRHRSGLVADEMGPSRQEGLKVYFS